MATGLVTCSFFNQSKTVEFVSFICCVGCYCNRCSDKLLRPWNKPIWDHRNSSACILFVRWCHSARGILSNGALPINSKTEQ